MLKLAEPRRYGRAIDDTALAFQEVGNTLESLLAADLARRVPGWTKPKPRCHRGIIGSPDGARPRSRAIDEIKATWVSERTFAESLKLRSYLWQLLFYMDAWQADRGYLHVLFVCGAYPKGAPTPSFHTFVVKPTRREKRENTDRLVQHAIDRGLLEAA